MIFKNSNVLIGKGLNPVSEKSHRGHFKKLKSNRFQHFLYPLNKLGRLIIKSELHSKSLVFNFWGAVQLVASLFMTITKRDCSILNLNIFVF